MADWEEGLVGLDWVEFGCMVYRHSVVEHNREAWNSNENKIKHPQKKPAGCMGYEWADTAHGYGGGGGDGGSGGGCVWHFFCPNKIIVTPCFHSFPSI